MIECIFTLDYEICGNGQGTLKDLVYEPAERLKAIFDDARAKLVVFVEVAELKMIASRCSDPYIDLVQRQVREFHEQGHEIALHLHPQWSNAQFENGTWFLDYSEYNLCTLSRERITRIVDDSLAYLRSVLLEKTEFKPLAFRAGNWLFQPTNTAAKVLAQRGVKIDSSVFKGGIQHEHGLDYRRAMRNGYYWTFRDDVNTSDPKGLILEVPIYTRMVPFWRMFSAKRVSLQKRTFSAGQSGEQILRRMRDFIRLQYPLKLDFCRMTLAEMVMMVNSVIREDERSPLEYRPIVAIGHSKDLVDCEAIGSFLKFLKERGIAVSLLRDVQRKCR